MSNEESAADGKVILGADGGPPPTCDVCDRVLPNIREGGIECHHDDTYTPLTPLGAVAELVAWRKFGKKVLELPGRVTADIYNDVKELVGNPTSDVPSDGEVPSVPS